MKKSQLVAILGTLLNFVMMSNTLLEQPCNGALCGMVYIAILIIAAPLGIGWVFVLFGATAETKSMQTILLGLGFLVGIGSHFFCIEVLDEHSFWYGQSLMLGSIVVLLINYFFPDELSE